MGILETDSSPPFLFLISQYCPSPSHTTPNGQRLNGQPHPKTELGPWGGRIWLPSDGGVQRPQVFLVERSLPLTICLSHPEACGPELEPPFPRHLNKAAVWSAGPAPGEIWNHGAEEPIMLS